MAQSYPYANVGPASVDVSAIPNCNIIQITHLYVIQIYVGTDGIKNLIMTQTYDISYYIFYLKNSLTLTIYTK